MEGEKEEDEEEEASLSISIKGLSEQTSNGIISTIDFNNSTFETRVSEDNSSNAIWEYFSILENGAKVKIIISFFLLFIWLIH